MNKEDIILLAIKHTIHGLKFNEDGLMRFANLVASAEREACAKIADEIVGQDLEHNFSALIAHNIRARGQA